MTVTLPGLSHARYTMMSAHTNKRSTLVDGKEAESVIALKICGLESTAGYHCSGFSYVCALTISQGLGQGRHDRPLYDGQPQHLSALVQ